MSDVSKLLNLWGFVIAARLRHPQIKMHDDSLSLTVSLFLDGSSEGQLAM